MTPHSLLLSLLRGERTVESVAVELGESEAQVIARRERLLARLDAAKRRPLTLALALVGTVSILGAGVAWAQVCMPPTQWDSQLVHFCADTPAIASDINANFSRIIALLQQKTGLLSATGIQTPTLSVSGRATAGAFATRTESLVPQTTTTLTATTTFANTDLQTSFTLAAATNVDISYSVSGVNQGEVYLVMRVLVDGQEVRALRSVNGNHTYMNNTARAILQLSPGPHQVVVQYRANGNVFIDATSDFMGRSLTIHVLGS